MRRKSMCLRTTPVIARPSTFELYALLCVAVLGQTCADQAMCEKCVELDERIEHYRSLAMQVMDDLMAEGIGKLIADLLAEKAGLHPADEEET